MFNLMKLCSRKIGFCCEQDWILLAAKSIVAVQGGAWFACGIVVRGVGDAKIMFAAEPVRLLERFRT